MVRQFYPFSPYLEAFDGVITATGYNSFHELMLGYTGPVMLAPTNLERLDDQIARATYARDKQWADVLYAARPEDHEQILRTFMAAVRRRAKVTNRPGSFVDQTRMVADIHRVCDRYAK
jgi:predicted glycosyltransferase